jgi:hypothetical protein
MTLKSRVGGADMACRGGIIYQYEPHANGRAAMFSLKNKCVSFFTQRHTW